MAEVENAPPAVAKNKLGLARTDYTGAPSTLCTGCGHDSITNHIISALFQSGINPYDLGKMSGIGCSSKTPAYFANKSFAFNSVHGRMPAVSTGAKLGNRKLKLIGVSGDGDTGSIGIGPFMHLLRRNLPIVYIIENNGVYGLTKGQFSATSEKGAKLKGGTLNTFGNIDLCALAIQMGCNFVARSFSGDAKQLVPLIEAAFQHNGTAIIDVISPCVTFNNHEGSTKSYDAIRDRNIKLQELGYIRSVEDIRVDYKEGETQEVKLPDGSTLTLKKLARHEHNIHDRMASLSLLSEYYGKAETLTGLFYMDQKSESLVDSMELTATPLAQLTEKDLRPNQESMDKILRIFQ
jgi:2-oxoglutarate/2-oxoacid ferredoxin oxidoreductase subunit beta